VGEGTAGPASSTVTEVRGPVAVLISICVGACALVARGTAEGQIYFSKAADDFKRRGGNGNRAGSGAGAGGHARRLVALRERPSAPSA
jgi:hypothetical protein